VATKICDDFQKFQKKKFKFEREASLRAFSFVSLNPFTPCGLCERKIAISNNCVVSILEEKMTG
jgi:hypothetical protein